jgi:N-acetylglutamate synthase-like GNAT family acetyltransferase
VSRVASVRRYEPSDLESCRSLWAELTQWHRDLYDDDALGGNDPGSGFDGYVDEFGAERLLVAEADREIVGLAGLIVRGRHGELEPVVVSGPHRASGIGRKLVEAVVETARAEGLSRLTVRPTARNSDALRFFHALGFDVLGHVDLQIDLDGRGFQPRAGERLAEKEFRV